MIISHKHKFIFLRTQKTAGASIQIALSKICGEEDVVSRMGAKLEKYKVVHGFKPMQNQMFKVKSKGILGLFKKPKNYRFTAHSNAEFVKSNVKNDVWNKYFKFCFERNPYDKVISWYYWLHKFGSPHAKGTLSEFIENFNPDDMAGESIYKINGQIVLDKIYKYEELDASLKDISTRLQLSESLALPNFKVHSKSRLDNRHYREVLSQKEVDIISNYFAAVIKEQSYSY